MNHKEIKLQKAMKGMDKILYEADLFLLGDLLLSATLLAMYTLKHFLSPPMYLCGIHIFIEIVFRKGMASLYVMTLI